MAQAWTISSGSELTRGRSVDTNAAWLALRLSELGATVARHVTVGDDLDALCEVLCEAAAKADFVILTGGLGPTEDDLTRAAFARAAHLPLEPDPVSLARIEQFFVARARPMPERNRVQALLPRGAQAIANHTGTAPGIYLQIGNCELVALPGVPSEMKPMFDAAVAPRIAARAAGRVLRYRCLQCHGMSEAEIGMKLADLMARGANPEVGTTASAGTIGVRIYASAADAAAAENLRDNTSDEVQRRLGNIIFGTEEDTLAGAIGKLLVQRRALVVTAESCTGGLVGKLFTDVPGSSAYYKGGVVSYSNELKMSLLGVPPELLHRHGAVSREVACAMASGARTRLAADYALSLTGIAGPEGGTADKPVGLVWIGLADANGVDTKELRLGAESSRRLIRERAAGAALNWLRLRLLAAT